MKGIKTTLITGFWVLAAATGLNAQLGLSWDLAKPEKFENRKLGYEKTYEKKYTLPRKFIQNTVSHYNFFFNANETVKEIFSAAKDAHKDTFSRLLDYYPYTIEQTAARKTDLDSVIIRSSGGILLHDLRTNWVDNFYLLIGIAYLLRKDYDSAIMTFNYINYEYAPKDKDGDRRIVGSNTNDGNDNNVFSISTREKRNLKTRLFERPPSRNESFIWMTRAYIEQEDFGSAAGMVQTLRNDPFFPKRLHDELDEITGYLFYRQNIYDSAAHYLVKSMSLANGRNEKARREYLAGQLYAMGNNPGLANEYFAKSVKHTLDPVMDVYARLNSIRLRKSDDPKIIDENISDLLKMARKDAYQEYRDVIYFFAAQMELERKNADAATPLLLKSVKYAGNNPGQRNQSVLALAEIAYNKKQFRNAAAWYDSLNTADPTLPNPDEILARKNNLSLLVDMLDMVQTEDSLQHVALMPPAEREDYLKKLLRRLRKEKGLKEDPNFGSGNTGAFPNRDEKPADLFNAERGEWYFYNSSLKSRGFTEFRNKWGNRPNIDGWRRSSVISQFVNSVQQRNQQAGAGNTSASKKEVTELTIEALMANLPISDSAMAISNDTIQSALFGAAKLYQYNFEDYERAIETWEDLLKRYPGGKNNEEALFNLYQCYMKTGQTDKAAAIKNRIGKEFPAGKLLSIINNPGQKPASENTAATKLYEQIYNLFIEGKFEEALQQKQQADAQYGNSFWTPQLLYIEAVYHIKQRNDSAARPALENIINLHPNSPMNARAQTLLDVLSRRAQIEQELASLQVTRVADDPVVFDTGTAATPKPPVTNPNPPVVNNPVKPVTPPVTNNPPPVTNPNPPAVTPPKPKYAYKHNPDGQHYAGIVLEKVDNIFSNEARNSFIIFNRSVGR
ncbi:MAG: tetratricopeptide repeat protein, partial [Dinghuibacter sp.]|nr:tetratricopeptide repeat protein [Dinghuibacter sp.]